MVDEDPTLTRLREADDAPRAFRDRSAFPWLMAGGAALVVLLVLTLTGPGEGEGIERVASILALMMFVAAVASWFGMGGRSIWVAVVVVAGLYLLSALTSLVEVHDLFLISLIVGLGLFVLAGFSLLFVLEEVVYDAHRLMRLRSDWWAIVPSAVVAGLLIFLPVLQDVTGASLGTLWGMAIACALVLALGWGLRIGTRMGTRLTREIDLLVAGALAGAALADAVSLLRSSTGLLPTFVAYGALVGTWVYVSFTTLQRAQYFLRAQDVVPWAALLLSSSFAVIAHVHAQFRASGALAFPDLVQVRVAYLLLGVWIGLAFFIIRGLWRISLYLRDSGRLGQRSRIVAGRVARLTEGALGTEHRLGDVTFRVLRRVDEALPGKRAQVARPAYVPLDEREGAPVEVGDQSRPRRRNKPRLR